MNGFEQEEASPQLRPSSPREADAAAAALPPEFAAPAGELPPPSLPPAPERDKSTEARRACGRSLLRCVFWLGVAGLCLLAGWYLRIYGGSPNADSALPAESAGAAAARAIAAAESAYAAGDFATAAAGYAKAQPYLNAEQLYHGAECCRLLAEPAAGQDAMPLLRQAALYYAAAAARGCVPAARAAGDCYYKGLGVPLSHSAAVSYYKQAAEQGDAEAQFRLAWCLLEQSPAQESAAAHWLARAAEQGNVAACYDLALCYLTGRGVEASPRLAIPYLQRAVAQQHPAALRRLAYCYRDGEGVAQDIEQALQCFSLAAAAGDAEAQFNYAWCLQHGYAILPDAAAALRLYLCAAPHYCPAQEALRSFRALRLLPPSWLRWLQKSQNYPKM